MATDPSNPGGNTNDNTIANGLAGGTAGNPPGYAATGGAGNPGASGGAVDANGNEVVVVGKTHISLDPRVQGSTLITVGGTMQIQASPTEVNGALSKAPPTGTQTVPKQMTVADIIQQYASWTSTQKGQFTSQAQSAGLIATAHPSDAELAQAWALVVEEGALQGKNPNDLIKSAADGGWQSIKPTLQPADAGLTGAGDAAKGSGSTTGSQNTTDTTSTLNKTTQTSYVSYMDPATAQSVYADSMYRLMGRMPTSQEYQAYLKSLYTYEDEANTGKFESGVILKDNQRIDTASGKVVDTKTGQPVPDSEIQRVGTQNITNNGDQTVQQNIVSQRGIGTSGAAFLASQDIMNNPEYGAYQAYTTYFSALQKALAGPGQGMTGSGPTNATV